VTVIKSVEVVPLKIPFVRPFKISRGYVGAPGQPGDHVYVKHVTSDGEVGWGEARPMPSWMYETVESVCTSVERYLAKVLVGEDPFNINKVHAEMERVLAPAVTTGMPFAKSAVDIALHDLVGKLTGAPLHALLGGKLRGSVEMAALVSGEPGAVTEYAKELRAKGYRCFKLKIMGDPELDGELVRELKEAVPEASLWLDANQAYTDFKLRLLLRKIAGVEGVICLEQPVPTYDFFGLRRIARASPIPVAVDESLFSHYDLMKLVHFEALDALVLKVAKSGIRRTLKIYALAEAAGLSCLGSGMTESGVGLTASTHVFSTLDLAAPVDTNGPQFLRDLMVRGLEIDGAKVKVPDKPGLGVEVDERKLEEYRAGAG
jgi:muconate cycloisomerase